MARFGRTSPPSTRLRASTARFEGPPPRETILGVAGEQTSARPVNRAIGEVRPAREQTTALAVGRAHARTPGVPVEQDTGRAFAGRAHRRDLGRAGETSVAVAPRRAHRRDVASSYEYSSARSILGDRPNVSPEAWAAAIEAEDRTPVMALTADWGRTGQYDHALSDLTPLVKSVTVDRSLSTSLPANVGIVEGSAAASMSVDLGGEWPDSDGITPTVAFAPYRPDAPFYRKPIIGTPVALDTGFITEQGAKTERRFTGSVRKVASKSKDRKVTLDAFDGANDLRAPVSLAANGLDSMTLAKYGSARYFARINSQWLIDYIARRNEIYASPAPLRGSLVAATMHGSSIPEIGYGGTPRQYATGSPLTDQAWSADDHPFGMLYPNPLAPWPIGQWYCDTAFSLRPNQSVFIQALVKLPATNSLTQELISVPLGSSGKVALKIVNGRLMWSYVFPSGSLYQDHLDLTGPTPLTGEWVSVLLRFYVNPDETIGIMCALNGSITNSSSLGSAVAVYADYMLRGEVNYVFATPVTNVSVAFRDNDPGYLPGLRDFIALAGQLGQARPQAQIDRGLNEWTGIPTISNEDSWDLLREVVSAEYGTVGFTPSGDFFFRSRVTTRERGEAEQIASSRSLADMSTTLDEASVRNIVSGTSSSYMIGDWEDVYTSSDVDVLDCGPGITTFLLPIPEDTCFIPDYSQTVLLYSDDTFDTSAGLYVNKARVRGAMTLSNAPGTYADFTKVRYRWFIARPGVLNLTIVNNGVQSIRFATARKTDANGAVTEGQPAFKFPGRRLQVVSTEASAIADSGSILDYGERSYDLGGESRWRQHAPAVAAIASAVLASLGRPAPVLDGVDVPHDPRRQLFDPVVVSDPDGLGTVLGTITGIRTVYSASGAKDSLTVRPIGAPGLGVLDDADLGRVGDSLVLGT